MSRTNYLQAVISDLQRTAGPYRLATHGRSIHIQMCQQQTCGCLFDHLVGAGEQRGRHFEAKRLRGLEIDDHLDLGGEFRSADRRASRALQNLIDKRRAWRLRRLFKSAIADSSRERRIIAELCRECRSVKALAPVRTAACDHEHRANMKIKQPTARQ